MTLSDPNLDFEGHGVIVFMPTYAWNVCANNLGI